MAGVFLHGARRGDDPFGGAYLTPLEVEPARFSLNPVWTSFFSYTLVSVRTV